MSALPRLVDCRQIMAQVGCKEHTALLIMRRCERKVRVGRRVFVYLDEAQRAIEELTVRDAA